MSFMHEVVSHLHDFPAYKYPPPVFISSSFLQFSKNFPLPLPFFPSLLKLFSIFLFSFTPHLSPLPFFSIQLHQSVSTGYLRECAKWDDLGRRFLVGFMTGGGVGQVSVPDDYSPDTILEEVPVIKDAELQGNASLGIVVDRPRNRLLVVFADLLANKYSGLAAYDLSSWKRQFLTHLSGPNDEKSFADDVAVDSEGNAYVTDAKNSKIWKVGVDGKFISMINSPLFIPKQWYKNLVGLNGIVYHPDGYLLVIHTFSGNLYKIDLVKGEEVKLINVTGGSLMLGDGLELLSPTKLVVAGNPAGRLVESTDGWETASLVSTCSGLKHRLATSATVKNGRVYLSHMIGIGYPKKKHALVEAVFSP